MNFPSTSLFRAISTKVETWFEKASAYMYNFKDGHFQFPYVANDPELFIEALKKTPFVSFDASMQCLETNSTFMKIKLKYIQVEEGFWITFTQSYWKSNVLTIALPIESQNEYYFLTYSRLTDDVQVRIQQNKPYVFESNSKAWTFYKSTTAINAYFQKKCKSFAIVFMFNKTWLERNILNKDIFNKHDVAELLIAQNAYKNYIYDDEWIESSCINLNAATQDRSAENIDMHALKADSLAIIERFFIQITSYKKTNVDIEIVKPKDRTKVERVEKRLNETLTTGFQGIEHLANEFDISPTKLKVDFKSVYGMSIFQYYQRKQMELSLELLKLKLPISQIATALGYENKSKFSAKFKDTFGILPSRYF